MAMTTHQIGKGQCPACGYVADCASTLSGSDGAPSPGDLSICLNCGELLQFEDGYKVKRAPDGIQLQLSDEVRRKVVRAQRLIIERGPLKLN